MGTTLERVVDDLETVRAWWPHLHADLVPGTRRRVVNTRRETKPQTTCPDCGWPIAWLVTSRQPYCTRPWSMEAPACSTAVSLGFSPASARVDVLDDLALVHARVLALEADVRGVLGDGVRSRPSLAPLGANVIVVDVAASVEARGHATVWQPNTDPDWQPGPNPKAPDPRGMDWLRTRARDVKLGPRRAVGGYPMDLGVIIAVDYLRAAILRLDHDALAAVSAVLAQAIGICRHAAAAGRRAARVPKACPICDRMSLIVVEAVYDPDTGEVRELRPGDRRAALCTADGCVCADDECSCRVGRRHRWGEDDWARLGLVITDDGEKVRTSA